ncbi:MAG: hypothetical protein B6A08_16625 [Sorangiineae bacterium NIC37A_2]|nr:MAG: hypothetical protein B6A08_16625 [Sorangiineae bacterium NIC37A_2]
MDRRASKRNPKLVAADAVSSIYDLTLDTSTWFSEVVSMVRSVSDRGYGVLGTIIESGTYRVVHQRLDGAHPKMDEMAHIGSHLGDAAWSIVGRAACADSRFVLHRASSIFSPEFWTTIAPFRRETAIADSLSFVGTDGAGTAIGFGAPSRLERPALMPPDRYLTQCVLPHVGIAFRIRRALNGQALDTEYAEAIFSGESRCLHAQGMAHEGATRSLLRAAVREHLRERCGSRATPDRNPRDMLLAGRWSLIDRYEENGRRYVVAYRNPAGVLDPRRLSERERDVVARVALGMSQKLVAAELGIKESTIATIAHKVVRKLGLRSTRELPLFWRDLDGTPTSLNFANLSVFSQINGNTAPAHLTQAERDVLKHVIAGQSNRQIAEHRGSSERTVANQIAALLRKLGASSRVDCAARAALARW